MGKIVQKFMKYNKAITAVKAIIPRSHQIVSYLTPEEVNTISHRAKDDGRNGERNYLLIRVLFETGLRVSEALSLTPKMIDEYEEHAVLFVVGKGRKPRMVACPDSLAYRLKSYAYTKNLGVDDKIFSINRQRAWQIIKSAAEKAGIQKRVYPHLFRHSDAIERLRQTEREVGSNLRISVTC